MLLFDLFVVAHVISGATGLVLFWVPVIARKGAHHHRKWGRLFAYSMMATGTSAIGMGLCTLIAPLPTHPELTDVPLIRGLFGWMMLYLAVLTIGLAWHGLSVVRNKSAHSGNRHWFNVSLQVLTIVAALNCAVQGFIIGQYLMVGVATAGLASAVIYLHFIFRDHPPRMEFLMQHFQASLGAGISVYTAFLAFGAVRLFPHHAFNPAMWAVPTIVGVGLMIYWRLKHTNAWAKRGLPAGKASSSGDLA
ncbi:hypothetical protein [Brevundimonas variabilis]|uniref:DUF2306 domain-containing protein n=1 Tax=Brevundimonas variabilis TaxID=74312 RepID=A0A7W9CGH6_9CAUL|nr:hypothetical protein [Brevundimonas variabilis]MBB5744767.1 hypothetical protein [Brevundimonas variabilis]